MTLIGSLKQLARRILNRPRGVQVGTASVVNRPWKIIHPERIRIGERTRVLGNAYWECAISPVTKQGPGKIVVGDGVYIGRYSFFTALNEIHIGDGCVFSDHVYVTDENHGLHPAGGPILEQPLESKGPVRIGQRCFIGYRAAILPGVTLGDHCVVGTNSTVTRSFPAYSMLAGSPAQLIKVYSPETGTWVAPRSPDSD